MTLINKKITFWHKFNFVFLFYPLDKDLWICWNCTKYIIICVHLLFLYKQTEINYIVIVLFCLFCWLTSLMSGLKKISKSVDFRDSFENETVKRKKKMWRSSGILFLLFSSSTGLTLMDGLPWKLSDEG